MIFKSRNMKEIVSAIVDKALWRKILTIEFLLQVIFKGFA
jgi:hypothetical protein